MRMISVGSLQGVYSPMLRGEREGFWESWGQLRAFGVTIGVLLAISICSDFLESAIEKVDCPLP